MTNTDRTWLDTNPADRAEALDGLWDSEEAECETDEPTRPTKDWQAEWDRAERVYWRQELQQDTL